MTDRFDKKTRSRLMSGIRGKDTKIEIAVRRALFRAGYRFRLHDARLPGKPDIVLKRHRAVIFVHGCFWHGHQCHLFRWPRTRSRFWKQKIQRNSDRDKMQLNSLASAGWRVAIVWECALRGAKITAPNRLSIRLCRWLEGTRKRIEIRGRASDAKQH